MLSIIINLIDYTNKKKVLNFFKKNLNDKLINVIDIGAHKGETINFFRKNFIIRKLFVFEPNKNLYEFLIKNFHKKIFFFLILLLVLKNKKKNSILVLIAHHQQ